MPALAARLDRLEARSGRSGDCPARPGEPPLRVVYPDEPRTGRAPACPGCGGVRLIEVVYVDMDVEERNR